MTDGAEIHARPKIVGARVKRTEDPRLLSGTGAFADDRHAPRALHVAFRRSEHSHARIKAIDCAAARKSAGVVAVFTAEDLAATVAPLLATSRMKGYHATPILPLARGKVRYVGEPLVGIVAQSRYLAEDALEMIRIEFEPLPVVIDPLEAVKDDAPRLHEEAGGNVIVSREFKRGDVDTALAGAPVRVKGRFRMHRKTAVAIEPRAYLAEYDAGRRTLTLHSATQVPGIVRDALATALDISGNDIRVVAADVGGGFGGKGSLYPEEISVCAAARLLGRSVKWTSDRMEDLMATSQAFDEVVDAELGLDAEGRALALKADVVGDVGAFSIYPWTAALEPVQVVSFLPGPYRIEHYRGRVRGVVTSKAPTGPYRGVGRPISTFVMERLIDMAAAKLGIDPKEMRLRNLVDAKEFPYKVASGIVWDKSGFKERLDAACGAIGYDELREKQNEARAAGRAGSASAREYAEHWHRLAHFGRARNADQHRHGNRHCPRRFDRRGDGCLRGRLAWTRTGNDFGADYRRASRRALRGHPNCAGRQCRGSGRYRYIREPQPGAGGRRRNACRAGRARESIQRCIAFIGSRAHRSHRSGRQGVGRWHRPLSHFPRSRTRGLFGNGAPPDRGTRGACRHQNL
jgi:carbon-monoxide dehydrogenase large subunit